MKLSVVIPAFNEARRILPSLERIFSYLGSQPYDSEVVVVDDGSTDATAALVRERFRDRPALRLLRYTPNRGKGYAVRQGALQARGDWVLISDADLSTPIEELPKLVRALEQGFDVAIGSRALPQSEVRKRQNLLRERAGKLFNWWVRHVVDLPFHDTQCGFKLFQRERMAAVWPHLTVDRFAFDVELLAVALALGRRVAEVPVVWMNAPDSTVNFWSGLEAYVEVWRIRKRVQAVRALAVGVPGATTPPTVR
ncbi:MAG: glycosyltransferase family 2 protein [Candidatus Binatia bacterium]|nr:glycosyltransferase family 2 protein [Candidatus Binatia bacterium]